ncbi:hypothetical protein K504DRAFT_496457 [Pleomassaria siparia CBS 279.74]|uniref:Uncharacterized protein n=1 Tax=Pleomassaria siparia CBS 279.74 TaxID=1314801 RepID=A0A6G1KPX7_9PLEO|nr:hypothetical protein K504DRAFT_496457 [Pleomassaria siparia CBS 279.74]
MSASNNTPDNTNTPYQQQHAESHLDARDGPEAPPTEASKPRNPDLDQTNASRDTTKSKDYVEEFARSRLPQGSGYDADATETSDSENPYRDQLKANRDKAKQRDYVEAYARPRREKGSHYGPLYAAHRPKPEPTGYLKLYMEHRGEPASNIKEEERTGYLQAYRPSPETSAKEIQEATEATTSQSDDK